MNVMSCLFIGYDCWVLIFSSLSFEERQRIRSVCKDWNKWLLEFKQFWPIGIQNCFFMIFIILLEPSTYCSLSKNISSGKYKQTKLKIEHKFERILAHSSLGIILVAPYYGYYKGFWIYSQTSFDLLYHFNESFQSVKFSDDYLVVKDSAFVFWLLSFQHSFSPKESIQLQNKTKIFEGTSYGYCLFEYPFLVNYGNFNPILIDVLSGKDLLKENKIQIPDGSHSHIFTREYYAIECPKDEKPDEIWVFQISNLTKTPLKIQVPLYYHDFFDGNMYFVSSMVSETLEKIDCYFLDSGKKTTTPILSFNVNLINKRFIIGRTNNKSTEIYRWNSDYTNLTLLETIQDCYSLKIDCFHSTLPFFAFVSIFDSTWKIHVFAKKNGKQVAEISVPKKDSKQIGDEKSRIYSQLKENNTYYLYIIDFANTQ